MVDDNTKAFYELLDTMCPDLVHVHKAMVQAKVSSDEIIGVLLKIGLIKELDDGYGKIIVETKPIIHPTTHQEERKIWRIRIVQDKIFKDDFDA